MEWWRPGGGSPPAHVLWCEARHTNVMNDAVAPLVDRGRGAHQNADLPAGKLNVEDGHPSTLTESSVARVLMDLGKAVARGGQRPGQLGPLAGVQRCKLIPERQPLLDSDPEVRAQGEAKGVGDGVRPMA